MLTQGRPTPRGGSDPSMSFRPLVDAEVATLAAVFPSTSEPLLTIRLAQQRAGHSSVIVGWLDGRPVGTATIEWSGPRQALVRTFFPDCAEIHSVEVDASARSDGIGSRLVAVCEGMAIGRGFSCVGLAVAVDNVHAYSLCLRLGYAEERRVEYDLAPGIASAAHGASRLRFLLKRL